MTMSKKQAKAKSAKKTTKKPTHAIAKKKTLKIDVGPNELSLSAESDVEKEEVGKTYLHRERAFSTFRRNIGFAESVDAEKVSAKMSEGILAITLPKLEPRAEKKTRTLTL